MSRAMAWVVAAVGALGAVLAFLLPWARYGDTGVELTRFPWWGLYAAAVVALHGAVAWRLLGGDRPARLVGVAVGLAAVAAAVVVLLDYDDGSALFATAVPTVVPGLGPGGPVAALAALLSTVAAAAPLRAALPRERRPLSA